MTAARPEPLQFARPPAVPIRRFTVEEYHQLGAMGVLTEDDRVELLEGWIVQRMIHNPRHDATIDKAHDAIGGRLPAGWRIRVRSAVRTADSEPEPDLAIVRGPAERYSGMHPRPDDIGFVVEVADTSLTRDQGWKSRLYAAAHFQIYWIINLVDNQVEVYTKPGDAAGEPGFAMKKDYKVGENVPLIFAGEEMGQIPVEDLLVL